MSVIHIKATAEPEYWRGLGQLIETFGHMEARLFELLAHLSGLTLPMARAVFRNARTDDMIQHVQRIGQVKANAAADELQVLFAQLRVIATIRNSLVHFPSDSATEGDARISTNESRQTMPEKATAHRVSPEVLADMTADLERITFHFHLLAYYQTSPDQRRERLAMLFGAWRYKSPPTPPPKSPIPR
jgi:hypothetical protein